MSKELEALKDDVIKITTIPLMEKDNFGLEYREKMNKHFEYVENLEKRIKRYQRVYKSIKKQLNWLDIDLEMDWDTFNDIAIIEREIK